MTNNKFGGAIWTNHALDRMKNRLIPKDYAIEAFKDPDSKTPSNDGIRYVKKIEDKTITVVAKTNEKHEWVILSVWMSPPAKGTDDEKRNRRYKEYKKASIGKKIWLMILEQLGV